MDPLKRKETARHAVLRYLAERQGLALSLPAIAAGVNHDGHDFETAEIKDAIAFLEGLEFIDSAHDSLGSTKRHKITSAGVLHAERN
jgi:hypothetical protein